MKNSKGKKKEKTDADVRLSRFFYVLLVIACFVFVLFFGGYIPYALFYLVVFAPPVFALFMLLSSLQIKCRQETDKKAVNKGEEVNYTCFVNNGGVMPVPAVTAFWKDGRGVLPGEKRAGYFLLPFRSEKKVFKIRFMYRGLYEFGISHVVIHDYLGLFKKKLQINEMLSITVYPWLVELRSLAVVGRLEALLARSIVNKDIEEFADIRQYQYGDPLNRVHWNLFAQKSDMFSKLYDSHNEWDIVILLDLAPIEADDSTAYEDYLIECCLAAVNYCKAHNCKLRLVYCQDNAAHTVVVRDNFDDVYRSMAYIQFSSELPLEAQTGEFASANAAVIFTAREIEAAFLDSLTKGCMKDIYRLLTRPDAERKNYANTGSVRMCDVLVSDSISSILEKSL